MGIRKTVAGWFIRTGQRIYRPTITDMTAQVDRICIGDTWLRTDAAIYTSGPVGPAMQDYLQRRESRGWN